MSNRIALLEKIEKLNKQLNFVGGRGEQLLTDEMLESLCVELENEVKKKRGK